MPRLRIRDQEGESILHEITDDVLTIGRAPENNLVLDDPSVSGRHAELRRVGSGFHVRDLGSTNGTRLNGETITDIALRPGDRMQFGKVEVFYEADLLKTTQPLPEVENFEVRPAETSARPEDFVNASPFPRRKQRRDPTYVAILAGAALAFLAFLASVIAVLQIGPASL